MLLRLDIATCGPSTGPPRVPLQEPFFLLQGLDADSCTLLVTCLCTADAEQKVFVRKVRHCPLIHGTPSAAQRASTAERWPAPMQEALRLLGLLGTPDCACQAQVFQPPLLGRVLGFLRSRLKARPPSGRTT